MCIGKIVKPSFSLRENHSLLNEFATLRVKDSGLPTNLWLDEGGTYQGHAPRLKFQASREQRTTREYSTMTLEAEPRIENLPQRTFLSSKDLKRIEMFVIANLDALLRLANNEIDYETEFLPNMVKV